MPELPEVETVMRGVAPALTGAVLQHVETRRHDLRWPFPENFAKRLTGRRVETLSRRSKYILAALDGGETWLTHLGMSGRFTLFERNAGAGQTLGVFVQKSGDALGADAQGKHDHVIIDTSRVRLVYTDPRRFGAMDLWPTEKLQDHPWLGRLGPEPLGNAFNAGYLFDALSGRFSSIKAFLLDQRRVAGLGNIYVCEALWRARISPFRESGAVAETEVEDLVVAIRAVLAEAISAGGSSLKDHRQADGELGYFQHSFAVYGQDGSDCARKNCAGVVERATQNGRSSFFCRSCQR